MSRLLRIDKEFIISVVNEFSKCKFTFHEIDQVLFFVDLDFNDFLVEEINKQTSFSKELIRDLVLIERKTNDSSIEHFNIITRNRI